MATAILILNYNTASDTKSCIQSIEAHNSAPIKYIVVDNGSPNKENVDQLDSFFRHSAKTYLKLTDKESPVQPLPYYTFITSEHNDGYAKGNNKGLSFAYADASVDSILILNSDILFTEDILPPLLQFQQQNAGCGLITPLIVSQKGEIDHCCARKTQSNWEVIRLFGFFNRDFFHLLSRADKRQKILKSNPLLIEQPSFPIDIPSGACMLIAKDLFRQIGGFDPGTFLYYEENILYKKLEAASRTSYCVPTIKCIHLGAGATRNTSSRFLQRCNLESAYLYLSKYGHLSYPQRLIWLIVKGLWLMKFRITDS